MTWVTDVKYLQDEAGRPNSSRYLARWLTLLTRRLLTRKRSCRPFYENYPA